MPTDREAESEGLVRVGTAGRAHGVDGAFVVNGASDDPRRFEVGAVLVVGGEPVRVVVSRRVGRGRQAIKLEREVERGTELFVRRSALPELEDGSYYVSDLAGLTVIEDGGRRLGVVRDVLPGPANDALELDSGILLPLVEDCVLDVDLAGGRILVARGFVDDR